MDLNYLLCRHQISLMRADFAATREARAVHRGFAELYARQIDGLRANREPLGEKPRMLALVDRTASYSG